MEGISINTLYRHFKGGYYLVERVAKNESDGQPVVVYTSVTSGMTFTRPYEDFFADISNREDNITHQIHRFEVASELKGLLKLTPTAELVEELETREDSPYEGFKTLEEDENVWAVQYLLGRVVEKADPKTNETYEEFVPLTLATFDTPESAKKYRERCYPNRPAVLARRITRKVSEI